MRTTWDGLPIAAEPPFGATVVVHRRTPSGLELLLLHRAHHGPAYEGDWAWTPPAGSRLPGEDILACAHRELAEEAGLRDVQLTRLPSSEEWAMYACEVDPDAVVDLVDPEHDRYEWVTPPVAVDRSKPSRLRVGLRRAVHELAGLAQRQPGTDHGGHDRHENDGQHR